MKVGILKLQPIGKDYIWGGNRLNEEFGKNIFSTPLAETWECSTHKDGLSIIKQGEFKGKTLKEVIDLYPEILGSKFLGKDLPILIKFIDAKEDVSVQVHPDDNFAMQNENQLGKTEMWYIVDAKEDASLVLGFTHPVDEKILKNAVETKSLDKHLRRIKVKKGECYFVPAGTVHGIGKGTLIAEIQESSNVTYRIYDYDRIDKNNNKRKLDFENALKVMDMKVYPDIKKKTRLVNFFVGTKTEVICRCEYFEVKKIETVKEYSFTVLDTSFQSLLCIEGEGCLENNGEEIALKKGDCLFIPASKGECKIKGKITLLKVKC